MRRDVDRPADAAGLIALASEGRGSLIDVVKELGPDVVVARPIDDLPLAVRGSE
jgi:hypothetical protein